MRTAAWSPAGADGTYAYQTAVAVAFWPDAPREFRTAGQWNFLRCELPIQVLFVDFLRGPVAES